MDSGGARYARQIASPRIGAEGQRRLGEALAVVVGVGATGGIAASVLARAGLGKLRVIDRDVVEESNLQRQVLFTDADARAAAPKAEAAAAHLRAANPDIEVEGIVADLVPRNAERLLRGAACIVDGTDNFETRLLVNDVALANGVPWIYAGVVATFGHTMSILPGRTACFRCYLPDLPAPGAVETCETAGVLAPAVHAVGGFAAAEALKILSGAAGDVRRGLLTLDVWTGDVRIVDVPRDPECRACALGERDFLRGTAAPDAVPLCGRDSVHVRAPGDAVLDLEALAARLRASGGGTVRAGASAVRFQAAGLDATFFADGRAIIKGTGDPARARSFYARFVGT
jgi:adenylyltransferase/sulfurtransferase